MKNWHGSQYRFRGLFPLRANPATREMLVIVFPVLPFYEAIEKIIVQLSPLACIGFLGEF
jgi:hypothetical protein